MNINPLATIAFWVTHAPWWQTAICYFLAIVLLGTLNKRLQRWRCTRATSCNKWNSDDDFCSHQFSAIGGYPLWPLFLPMTLLYTLAESKPSSWPIFKKKELPPDVRRQ